MSEHVMKAVLFDMDGVLIDSRTVIERAWREAAQMYGRTITDDEIHQHIHGQPGPHTIQALFHDLPHNEQAKVQKHIIDTENTVSCEPIAGVAEFIANLNAAGVKIGIVTSSWRYKINNVIAQLNAELCFSVIVERDDVTRGKPFPDPYLLAAKRLGIATNKTIVFEDAKSGVTSAVAAGAYCIGIGDEDLIPYGANFTMPNFLGIQVKQQNSHNAILSCPSGHELVLERLFAHLD